MRNASRVPVVAIVLAVLLCAAVSFAVPPAKIQPRTNRNVPPSQLCRLPDLVVVSLTIELVSTTVGQPGVEFPADKLKITAVVKDNGSVKSPGKFRVRLLRGLTTVLASRTVAAPTAPGQVWSLVHTMTYTHGVPPAFFVKVDADFNECDKANNTLSIGLNDEVLHRDGKQQAGASGIGTVQVPGSVVILF
jgi:hypothetical protein